MKNKYAKRNAKTVLCLVGGFILLCAVVILVSGDRYQDYLGQDEYENCMKVDDYGEAGNENGVLFQTKTMTPDYQQVYSLWFESYYMTSVETAYQKYETLYKEFPEKDIQSMEEKVISDHVKVRKIYGDDSQMWFIIQNDTTVFKAFGYNETLNKKQKWFDILKIPYQVEQKA